MLLLQSCVDWVNAFEVGKRLAYRLGKWDDDLYK